MTRTPLDDLRAAVQAAAGELRANGAADRLSLERPKKAGFGDYSTNAAMLLAPLLGEPPRAIAEKLGASLQQSLGDRVERVEVAGPGFLNLFLSDAWYLAAVRGVLDAGDRFGAGDRGGRVQVEFVSANPTGPLTAASGRHAAFGDALARILELAGDTVEREYYFNDGGGQVRRLGESILARARGEEPPEDGYQGEYVAEVAARIPGAAEMSPDALAAKGIELLMAGIRETLDRYRVTFDHWFLERSLYEGSPSAWDEARAKLLAENHAYESEGALWLRTTALAGDEKDRPLVKSNGEPTYLAADVAYHWDKLRPRVRPARQRARRRPPRLRRPPEGDHRRGGRRPRPADRPAAPVRARRRGRRARVDVQAPRRLRHAQRADRRDRRRRHALLHALALGRLDRRPRPDARQGAVAREPRLLRPVRARADVEDPPRRRRRSRAGGARRDRRGARARAR